MVVVDVCGGDVCEAVSSELCVWDGELEVRCEDGQRLVKQYELAAEGCSEEEGHYCAEVVPAIATADVVGGLFIVMGGMGGLCLLIAKLLAGLALLVCCCLLARSGKVSHEGQGSGAKLSWM